MAVAGGAVPACRVQVNYDGSLRIEPSVMVQRDYALSVDDALDALDQGLACYLKLYGENLRALQRRWQERIGEL